MRDCRAVPGVYGRTFHRGSKVKRDRFQSRGEETRLVQIFHGMLAQGFKHVAPVLHEQLRHEARTPTTRSRMVTPTVSAQLNRTAALHDSNTTSGDGDYSTRTLQYLSGGIISYIVGGREQMRPLPVVEARKQSRKAV